MSRSKQGAFAVWVIGDDAFYLPPVPREVALAVRTVGNCTFFLPWVPPPAPSGSLLDALVTKWNAFSQRLTELLRKLDNRLASGKEKVRLRRLARDAGLTLSERGISACRRWPWWGWWAANGLFCSVWFLTWYDSPMRRRMSIWLILLAGGVPWLAVAAGITAITLAAYPPRAVWNWLEGKVANSSEAMSKETNLEFDSEDLVWEDAT